MVNEEREYNRDVVCQRGKVLPTPGAVGSRRHLVVRSATVKILFMPRYPVPATDSVSSAQARMMTSPSPAPNPFRSIADAPGQIGNNHV